MDKPRPCGCKGCRTCLICEKDYDIDTKQFNIDKTKSYVYCPYCNKAWPGWATNDTHPNHVGDPIAYPGVLVDLNFLSEEEERLLIEGIDAMPWDLSQSGRRKQNFGPKCNFKKNKLRLGDFEGFPLFSKFVQDKFDSVPALKGFRTVEQCPLEYTPERGASIDPHIDDCWVWGERVVSVNLLADSVLTMTYNDKPDRYNLHCVRSYSRVLNDDGEISTDEECYEVKPFVAGETYPVVRIPMPRRSLLVIFGSARYDWEHRVLRKDVAERRICLAYREFTPPYLPSGSKAGEGEAILLKASQFWDSGLG